MVFDLDGTLYDFEKPNDLASKALTIALSLSLNISIEKATKSFAQGRVNVKRRLGATASSHNRILYIAEAFRLLKVKPDTHLLIRLEEIFWENYLKEMNLYEGVKGLLNNLRTRGIPIALVTDLTASIQYRKISKLGLNGFFDVIVTSEEAGTDKLSGVPFDLLRDFLGQFPPNSWFFGDSDFDHPNKQGHKSIFFKKVLEGDFHQTQNYFIFKSYLELIHNIEFV